MRAFIAIDIAEEVLCEIAGFVTRMQGRLAGARWVETGNLHLTLRFLGESDESTLAAVAASLKPVASRYKPFSLNFRGVGFFPSAHRPRIFWVGLNPVPEELRNLQRRVEAVVRGHGFEPEKRRFSPHLTLARFRNPRSNPGYAAMARELGGLDFGTSIVPELVLYQSILKREGAEYRVLERLTFST